MEENEVVEKAADKAVERLETKIKAIQKEQFGDIETRILEKIEKGQGFADLAEKSAKMSKDVASLIDEVKATKEKATSLHDRQDEFEKKFGDISVGGQQQQKSIGQEFIAKALKDEQTHQRAFERQRSETITFEKGAEGFISTAKNISTASGSGLVLADSLRLPGVVTQPEHPLTVQALIPRTFTPSRAIDYVRELVYTDQTATVAESTGTGDLQTKPQGNITFQIVTETMKTIAQWIPASRQVLLYSNRTQLQSYIDRRLRDRVLLELEDQVLLGSGTGNNMTGLVTDSTAYNRGYANIAGAAPTNIDTVRRAVTQLQLVNYMASGLVLNPADWEEVELAKDTQLRYLLAASPQGVNTPRLWGIPVVPSNRMTVNKFLLGDFASGAELFIGMDVTVEVSREHASFFVQNMVAILAEMFATLAIYRPEGIIYGGLLNADS